jgi:hypothetical protein
MCCRNCHIELPQISDHEQGDRNLAMRGIRPFKHRCSKRISIKVHSSGSSHTIPKHSTDERIFLRMATAISSKRYNTLFKTMFYKFMFDKWDAHILYWLTSHGLLSISYVAGSGQLNE